MSVRESSRKAEGRFLGLPSSSSDKGSPAQAAHSYLTTNVFFQTHRCLATNYCGWKGLSCRGRDGKNEKGAVILKPFKTSACFHVWKLLMPGGERMVVPKHLFSDFISTPTTQNNVFMGFSYHQSIIYNCKIHILKWHRSGFHSKSRPYL